MLTFPNGKRYVGQTRRTVKSRLAQHRNNLTKNTKKSLVYNGWRKHGAPRVDTLGEYPDESLNHWEAYWIAAYKTIEPHGYNLTSGGDSAPGIRTAESRARTSQALKGKSRRLSIESRKACRDRLLKASRLAQTPEVKRKRTAAWRQTTKSFPISQYCVVCGTRFDLPRCHVGRQYCNRQCRSSDPTYRAKLSDRI
jgi:hypothetical protein